MQPGFETITGWVKQRMCGIAGIIDLHGRQNPDRATVARMTDRLTHRGPDADGYLFAPGFGFGHRRLSIVGLADGNQPIYNEDRTVAVVFNGEIFDHVELRAELEAKGHRFKTHTDTEVIVHLYEEHGEGVFERLNGQFALALVDFTRRTIFLARDKVGICPLHWTRRDNWIYFGSEAKSILASGDIEPICDVKALNQVFEFFALGTRRSMFKGVQSLLPGHYLKIAFEPGGRAAEIAERRYWDLDFPDRGSEESPRNLEALVDEFQATFERAVEKRLRADVPVVSYLSGGVDSAYVLATAAKVRGTPPPCFTIQVPSGKLDEASLALNTAKHLESSPTVVRCDANVISGAYADLIGAADSPVIDTSCAALFRLAGEVRNQGYKVALTGEGADEAFAGYIWFKMDKFARMYDVGRFRPSVAGSRLIRKALVPGADWSDLVRADALHGGPLAQTLTYGLVGRMRDAYFSHQLKDSLRSHTPYEDLELDREKMRRWHPLNRALYLGYKLHLPGLLLNHKGDRVAMANSVETRYPFLDEDVIKFAARLHPSLKLKGLRGDKYLLRKAAERRLPKDVAWRPKGMFRAPFAESFFVNPPSFVQQLMSAEALKRSGYFDATAVRRDYERYVSGTAANWRVFLSMGLGGVLATQLWHHLYLDGGLCDLPSRAHVYGSRAGEAAVRALAAG